LNLPVAPERPGLVTFFVKLSVLLKRFRLALLFDTRIFKPMHPLGELKDNIFVKESFVFARNIAYPNIPPPFASLCGAGKAMRNNDHLSFQKHSIAKSYM